MKAGALLRHLTGWLLTVATLLLMLVSGLIVFLQTERGIAFLEDAVARLAARGGMTVTVDIARVTAHHIVVPAIDVADAAGVFLRVRGVDLRIDSATYWRLAPVIDSLVVAHVGLDRLPAAAGSGGALEKGEKGAALPAMTADIRRFDIHEIRTGPAVYGAAQDFTLESRLKLSSRFAENDVFVRLTAAEAAQREKTHVELVFQPAEAPGAMRLQGRLRDAAGGMVTRLIGLPKGYGVDVDISAAGTAKAWEGETSLRFGTALSGNILMVQDGDRLSLTADLKGPRNIFVKGMGSLPVGFDPPRIDWRGDLAGHMETTINLETITLLLGLDDHRMTGEMRLEATLAGTLKSPKLTGAGHIRGGSYENLSAGTRLTGLTADIAATRDEITLSSLSARTARNGSVSGKGAVSLKDVTDPVFNFTLALDKAQVMQLQNMEARVSGALQGAGRADGMELSGDLKIDGAEVYLAGFGSGSASSMLNIKEVNVPPRLRRQRGLERPAAPPYRIGLDVRVRAPGRIFVRAQGLESEWGADLHVTGSAAAPALDGYLKLIRGRYEFFDALLTLDGGTVGFGGGEISNPDLDLRAHVRGNDVRANIAVGGTAALPDVSLTSEPPLPQDEILARILFGKAVNDLSPMEMVRIAQIVGVMTGKISAGPDPISRLRKKAGIDMLNLNRDDKTGATSVSVGKYLADGVYVSVDQGLNAQDGSAVKLEMELTPHIQLQTRVGSDADNSVGINWKKDY